MLTDVDMLGTPTSNNDIIAPFYASCATGKLVNWVGFVGQIVAQPEWETNSAKQVTALNRFNCSDPTATQCSTKLSLGH